MPNILLTTGCNLSCSYCFAQEKMYGQRRQHMAMEDVRKVIDFLERSRFMLFRVMGGEPTLHPHFPEIVRLALAEGMRVDVLSNATWGDDCVDLFERIPPGRVFFLLNIDHPDNYTPRKWARIERNLTALSEYRNVTLSFNIFEKIPRYEYIFDLTCRFGIRMIRMSFSLPVLGAHNSFLDLEDYHQLTQFIMRFVHQAEQQGISVRLDNAVPLCIFDDAQAGKLLLDGVLDLRRNSRCEPIVDIGPDLSVWCCFCISKLHNRKLEEFENLAQVEAYYRDILRRLQSRLVPMEKCHGCRYRELWACQGGCITYPLMQREEEIAQLLQEEPRPTAPEPEAVLALADDTVVRRYDLPSECYVLRRVEAGVEIELERSLFEPVLNLLDGNHTVREIRESGFNGGNGRPAGEDPTEAFLRSVRSEGVDDLLAGLQRQGFVVERSRP